MTTMLVSRSQDRRLASRSKYSGRTNIYSASDGGYNGYNQPGYNQPGYNQSGYNQPEPGYNKTPETGHTRPMSGWNKPKSKPTESGGVGRPYSSGCVINIINN